MSHGTLGHATATASEAAGPLERIAHHLGMALTLGYVLLSVVGVVFETLLLRAFGTDFLTYAEPEDFLMAGLRHPVVLGFVVLSVCCMGVGLCIVMIARRASKRYDEWKTKGENIPVRKWIRRCGMVGGALYYFYMFTAIYARHEAEGVRRGEETPCRLTFVQGITSAETGPLEGYVVATTGRYLFFYDRAGASMQVIPTAAVRQLQMPARGGSPRGESNSTK